jgi:hypothetical protein
MWPVAIAALIAGGPFGVVLFLAAGITAGIKTWKVDAEFAKRGEMPPSARLVDKWLDARKAKGQAPASAKVKPYGSWAYFRQRWQAMWEDLGEKHTETRRAYKTAVAEAKRTAGPVPPKPTMKETLTGWKWSIPELTAPGAGTPAADESATVKPTTAQTPTAPTAPGPQPSGQPARRATAGPAAAPGAVATLTRPASADPHRCPRCGGPVSPTLQRDLGMFCPRCDTRTIDPGPYPTTACESCHQPGRMVDATPATPHNKDRRSSIEFLHNLNQSTRCPSTQQIQNDTDRRRAPSPAQPAPSPSKPVDPGATRSTTQPATPSAPTEGDTTMTAPAQTQSQQSGEVTGLASAIQFAGAVAAAHEAHSTGGGEGYRASLGQANVGDETIQSAADAQEKSQIAGAAWRVHEAKLREQLAAKEATTAETGTKEFLLSE